MAQDRDPIDAYTETPRGWAKMMAQEGPEFITWLGRHSVLRNRISITANAISQLLFAEIDTEIAARKFWQGVPRALSHESPETMAEDWGIVRAYAWLHFLERYARTWSALQYLLEERRLPMGRYGVKALDVGAGLGPASFAIHDFYTAMVDFAAETDNPKWHQPPDITCVERATGFSAMRSQLWEMVHSVTHGYWPSRLSRWNNLTDFTEIHPSQERADEFARLRGADITYWDDFRKEEASELLYTDQEAHEQSQSMHRYRLFVFANFFTSHESVDEMAGNLGELLADANPGSVLLVMGGEGSDYPGIYKQLQRIAVEAGFRIIVPDARASSEISSVDNIVSAESLRIFQHAQKLNPNDDPPILALGDNFAQGLIFPANAVRAFRKHRNARQPI